MTCDLIGLVQLFTEKAEPKDMVIFALLIVITFERWNSTKSSDKVTDSIIRALYKRGHLDDRRREQRPIDYDRRQP
jgi:hypothetical protein